MSDMNLPVFFDPNKHPSFTLAIDDSQFIRRDELRSIRLMLEYEKIELILRDWGIKSIITAFGSARIRPESELVEKIRGLHKSKDLSEQDKASQVERLERLLALAKYYDHARQFAKIAAERGGSMNPYGRNRHNVLASGGGPGIMEAINLGARDAGAPTIGFGIELPHEQGNNAYITPALSFNFHYFSVRKFHMVQRTSAVVVFPGGLGSLDELAEAMVLRQTGKSHQFPILLYGRDFWKHVVNFDYLINAGMMSPSDMDLIVYADTPEEAWDQLVKAGIDLPS